MKKQRKYTAIVAGMMLIAFGVYEKAPLTHTFLSYAQASDEEDVASSNEEDEDNNDSQNKESDKKAEEIKKESIKKAEEIRRESTKKAEEIKRESTKKSFETEREATKRKAELLKKTLERSISDDNDIDDDTNELDDEKDDVNEDSLENDTEGDDINEEAEKSADRLKHVAEKIAEAEQYILEQQSEGKNVTIALERLSQAKNMFNTAGVSLPGSENHASEDLVKEALKLTHIAREDDVHDINDVDKFVKKASERIDQATKKLSQLATAGGDTKLYQAMIDMANADLKSAKDMILKGSLLDGATLAQKAESEAKSAKKAIESALLALGFDDDELSGDHKSVVAKAVEDLLFVANVEGENGIGKKVREIARDQRDSADTVDSLIDDAQSRSKFSEFILGPKYKDLVAIQKQVTDNATRIQSLIQVKNQLTDTDLQQVVQEHIDALNEENTKLQSFVSGKETHKGVFGWVFRLLQ
jgi:hypothetical protein